MGTRQTNLIIPVEYLDNVLPEDADNQMDRQTNAVTMATAFVNTYASHYLPFDGYSVTTGSGDEDDTYTINAPNVIAQICTQVAIAFYFLSTDQVMRDGEERQLWNATLDRYKEGLRDIEIEPDEYQVTVSLDSEGYQLIARNQNIIPNTAFITSGSSNIWNNGEHFYIRKGQLDADDYYFDGWYLDGSNEKDDLEGTLTYYRSYRRDGKDYMKSYKTRRRNF